MIEAIPIVILAGGQGSRIGGGKSERRLAGRTLLDHATAKAFSYSAMVAISVRAGTQPAGDLVAIHDESDVQGPVAGLMTALKFASDANAGHVMIIPCDTPFLPDNLLQRLHGEIGRAAVAIPQCAGQLHSACSLWRVDSAKLLPEYLAQGRRSLIGFAEKAGHIAVEWPESDADRFLNINDANDMSQAEQVFKHIHPNM